MAKIATLGAMAKYWAGQKLLHSPLHPYYLKLSGNDRRPQTYDDYLAAERAAPLPPEPAQAAARQYRLVTGSGVRPAPCAAALLLTRALETNADIVYADEDVIDAAGRRTAPVFRPDWSPELFSRCNYLGDSYLIRNNAPWPPSSQTIVARVPRVLFHRPQSATYNATPQHAVPREGGLVSIVICSRSPKLLTDCLQAIRDKTSYKDYRVIVVDHISEANPGMADIIASHNAARVEFRGEFHFGAMCQAGVNASDGRFILFLNDDTAPLSPDWLTRMVAQAERPSIGAVGALLYYPDGRIQHAGVFVGTNNGAGHPGRLSNGSPMWPWLEMTREQSAVTAACMLMRREVFKACGGFDPAFPVNYNDVDLCLRVREAGFDVLLEAESKLVHFESTTRKTGIRYKERRLFLDRWAKYISAGDRYFSPNLTGDELLLPDPGCFVRLSRLTHSTQSGRSPL